MDLFLTKTLNHTNESRTIILKYGSWGALVSSVSLFVSLRAKIEVQENQPTGLPYLVGNFICFPSGRQLNHRHYIILHFLWNQVTGCKHPNLQIRMPVADLISEAGQPIVIASLEANLHFLNRSLVHWKHESGKQISTFQTDVFS